MFYVQFILVHYITRICQNIYALSMCFKPLKPMLVKIICTNSVPNVLVEWLTHLLRIWEVPGSTFGPETG
jgi:hypothetical protein